jgi:hypothetical protein
MFLQSIKAIFSAIRLLCKSRRVLALLVAVYAALLTAVYLFVSTRETTIPQLVLTLILVLVAPALFFLLQAVSVSYANGPTPSGVLRKVSSDSLKLIVVSVPVFALTLLALYGLNKLQAPATTTTTIRYLLVGLVAPLLAIQLWLATSIGGLRSLWRSLKKVLTKTLAPQSVFVYACGFLVFAVAPYLLLIKTIPIERAWLEFSLLILRLTISALLILLGWVTTVGALSILSRSSYAKATEE